MSKKQINTNQNDSSQIETVEYSNLMQQSFVDYALSVIIERAVPDLRDGLKPVQRRILYDMYDLKINPDKPHKKSARIVGDTMGRFHPHGDSSIYEALVRMSQIFKSTLPLVDLHGNGGSLDGDPPAAQRYTESRLSPAGYDMVALLNDKIVPFIDNFDGSEKEPTILPTLIPNLFLSGINGLAVGMRTEIPTHNLGEVIDAILEYMKNSKITTKELMKYMKGPDFPTGGIITNKKDLLNLYETGTGKINIRSKINIEDGLYGKKKIIITEIPYTFSGNKMKLIENLINLVKEKKLDEISDIIDESDKTGVRIVLEIKKGVNIDKFLNKLYSKSKLEDSESCNFLVIKGVEPMIIGLKDYIKEYLLFQQEIYTNKYLLYLEKAKHDLEILDGLCIAYDNLDAVIETIRYSKNITTAKKCLTSGDTTDVSFKTKKIENVAKKFSFTMIQAQTILDMKLQRLNGLEITTIEKNREKCLKEIEQYEKILKSKRMLNNVIKKDLIALKDKYAVPRKTQIIEDKNEYIEEKNEIIEETLEFTMDRFNYVKTLDVNTFSRLNEETLSTFKKSFKINSTDKVIVITNIGTVYQIKASDIPKTKVKEKGIPISNLCKMDTTEKILFIAPFNEYKQILYIFNDGYVKKVNILEYESRQKKIVGTKLYNNELINVFGINTETELMIDGEKNKYRIKIKDIPLHKKNVKGNKMIKLKKNDEIKSININ